MVKLLDWIVLADTNTLRNIDTGDEVKLSPRTMDVLRHFIASEGKLVTSSELLDRFWGNSDSSDHAVHNAIADLRAALGDRASDPRYIKTYSKRGYVLIAKPLPVQAATDQPAVEQEPALALENSLRWKYGLMGMALAACIGLLGLGLVALLEARGTTVLFIEEFEIVNVDPENQYWAEQLPASLISQLSKIENMEIVSGIGNPESVRFDADAYAGNTDFTLAGSILQADSRLRLQISLLNSRDSSVVFSGQFDLSSAGVFDAHDEVGDSITTALSVYLDDTKREEMRGWGTSSPIAYSLFLDANFHATQSNHGDLEIALARYTRAIEEDRDFIKAYVGLARAVNALGVYSHEARNIELREIAYNALREVLRISPNDESVPVIRDIALRLEGNDKYLIEESLRDMILTGTAPEFAYTRYAALLTEARLYYEAEQFLGLTGAGAPFEFTPGSNTYATSLLESPDNLVHAQIQNLVERPGHIPILQALIRGLIFSGDQRQAAYYLERQMEIDEEGPFSMLSQVVISSLWGSSSELGDNFESLNASNPDFHLSHGTKSFIQGDIASGVEYWRSLTTADLRRLSIMLNKIEIYFPEEVLADPRYLALLEELNVGQSWQRHLMESVREMSAVTGIDLHSQSIAAYNNNEFLIHNNSWNHEEVEYPNRNSESGIELTGS